MQFQDRRGRTWTLTRVQAIYLAEGDRQHLECGWGGMRSTLVVRLLEERGLATVRWSAVSPRWTITSLTKHGESVLAAWRARNTEATR